MGQEEELVLQLTSGAVPKSVAFGNIHAYLQQQPGGCCWCQHFQLAQALLELFWYPQTATTQQIWQTMASQLAVCGECIKSYREAQDALFLDLDHELPRLEVLWGLDKQRLLTWAHTQQQQQPNSQDESQGLSTQRLALFELLVYPHYLDDAELCAAAVQLLEQQDWDLGAEAGVIPYPGVLRLLAHPDATVRSKARSELAAVGLVDSLDDAAQHTLTLVLDCWMTALQPPAHLSSYAAMRQRLVEQGHEQQWQHAHIWSALKPVLDALKGDCMFTVLQLYPTVVPAVLAQVTPSSQGVAVPVGLMLSAEGSLEQKHALRCLHSMVSGLKQELWQLDAGLPTPQQLVQQLEGSVWAAVRSQDTMLLKELVQVLQEVAQAVLPLLKPLEAVELWSDGEDEQGGAAQVLLDRGDCKHAVLLCLRLLLVQLPGSASVPLLIRGCALEAGLAVCLSALQSPSCPGSAVFAHLWAPVCAALLLVPSNQYSSQHVWQQQQEPGIARMLPVLQQIADLHHRVTEAAAGLVATALQADAAVIHSSLSRQHAGPAVNRPWLLPDALDVVELSVNSSAAYTAAPSMWLALAGCGHEVVSASFIAAAALLVPLASSAAGAARRLQVVWPAAQQQLEASLQAPDPETVDLLSTSHAVVALEAAGWLHQQFTRAAVRHMHICCCRSRLFLLPPLPPAAGSSSSHMQTSTAPAPDHTAAAAYALAVRGCCTIIVQGKSGSAAVLAAEAQNALLTSCGVPLGEVKQAVQQHLLAPGSVCAESVVDALQQELQHFLAQDKLTKVMLKSSAQLSALFELSGYCLAAAVSHGLEVMLPLFAGYLPGLWQLTVDALHTSCKLLTSSTACAACSSGALGSLGSQGSQGSLTSPPGSQGPQHMGPALACVLQALLNALPSTWQCYQALLTQRCEQRQLYLDAAGSDAATWDLGTPLSPPRSQGTPAGALSTANAVAAELHRQSAWLVELLQLGKQLHSEGAAAAGGCAYLRTEAAGRRLPGVWRDCLQDVVKATLSTLPKAVKAAAAELMQDSNPTSLDKLHLAQLFPSAAPGNLASSGLGGWPSRLARPGSAAEGAGVAATKPPPAAHAPAVNGATAAAAAAAAAVPAANAQQPGMSLSDFDVVELIGDWSESGDEAAAAGSSDGGEDDVIVIDSSEEEQEQEAPVFTQPSRGQPWPWLRKQAGQQQQQPRSGAGVQQLGMQLLQQEQQQVKEAVSKLLKSHKTLNASQQQQQQQRKEQLQQQQQNLVAAAAQRLARKPFQRQQGAGDGNRHGQAGSAEHADTAEHLLRFKPPGRPEAPHGLAAQQQQPTQPQQQWQLGQGSRQGSADPDLEQVWPEEWRNARGAPPAEPYRLNRYNRPAAPRKNALPGGLSKAEELRVELGLSKPPQAGSSSFFEEAALAAQLTASIVSRPAAAAGAARQPGARQPSVSPPPELHQQQQQQHRVQPNRQQQQPQHKPAASKPTAGLTAAQRAQVQKAAGRQLQKLRQQQEQQLLMQRWQERQEEDRQREVLRQQRLQEREERRKAAAAAADADAATAAGAAAGIHLISDDALFRQAAAAAAASRPKAQAASTDRPAGALFLRAMRPRVMARVQPAAPAGRQYPVLRVEDAWAELLSWGYRGAVGSGSGSDAATAAAAATRKLLEEGRVPLRFKSVGHYCAVFRGLLLEELRAGLAAAHEELVAGSSGSSTHGGSFRSMPLLIESVQRQSRVFVVKAQVDTSCLQPGQRDSPRSEDYVLLTRVQLSSGADLGPDRLPHGHLSGLVVEATHLQPGLRQVTLHVSPASAGSEAMANFWRSRLVPKELLYVSVITSLVPNFREFQALIALQHAPTRDALLRHVLQPKPPSGPAVAAVNISAQLLGQLRPGLRQALQTAYNASQCAAVAACLDRRLPFVLVQGPPGTGKTATIVGMLSALLGSAEGAQGGQAAKGGSTAAGRLPAAAGRQQAHAAGAQGATAALLGCAARSALQLGATPSVRVLVCAQSNAAIDELLIRLATTGVWSSSGARRAPGMVRMGRSDAMHPSILMYHVDALADAAVQQQALARAHAAAAAAGTEAGQDSAPVTSVAAAAEGVGVAEGAAAVAPAAAAAAAPAAGQSDLLEGRMQQVRERLKDIEAQLAAVAEAEAAAGQAADKASAAAAADASGLVLQQHEPAEKQQQQPMQQRQGVHASKRSRDADQLQVGTGAAGASMQPPPAKVPRAALATAATAHRTAAAEEQQQQSDGSGSDMEVSDGEGAPCGRSVQQAAPATNAGQAPQAAAVGHVGDDRAAAAAEPVPQHQGSAAAEGRAKHSRRRNHSRSRSRSRRRSRSGDRQHKRRNRSSSRGRGSREEDRHQAAGISRRKPRRDRSRSSSRDRTRSSSRGRSRSSSRDRGREKRSSREKNTSREVGSSRSKDKDSSRGRSRGSRDEGRGREAAAPKQPPQQQQLGEGQQVQHPAARASLLRDQQRSLLCELRRLEQEQEVAGREAPAADRRELNRARRDARQAVIQAAEVVLCTLSASGGDLLNAFPPGAAPLFDVVVVDEAAQALEPATLIPLQLIKPGSGRVVLVGDPCQLPPTVLSRAAEASLLTQSLFERLARAGWPVQLLREQYRSHPAISAFPSRFFYQGQLLDGASVNAVTKGGPFHSKLAFGPMVVWDCQEGRERRGGSSRGGGSLQNQAEAELAATLIAGLLSSFREAVGSIAVISPYKAQVACLKAEFRRHLGGEAALTAANIEFGTVDGFQGREADVVVFSCVRAQPEAAAAAAAAALWRSSSSGGAGGSLKPGDAGAAAAAGAAGGPHIGFLQDVRRMNVGLTRGRRAVWVVCHADTLAASPAWRPLLHEARTRGVLLAARYPFRRLLTAGDRQLQGIHYQSPVAAPAAVGSLTLSQQAAAAAAAAAGDAPISGSGPPAAAAAAQGGAAAPAPPPPGPAARPRKSTNPSAPSAAGSAAAGAPRGTQPSVTAAGKQSSVSRAGSVKQHPPPAAAVAGGGAGVSAGAHRPAARVQKPAQGAARAAAGPQAATDSGQLPSRKVPTRPPAAAAAPLAKTAATAAAARHQGGASQRSPSAHPRVAPHPPPRVTGPTGAPPAGRSSRAAAASVDDAALWAAANAARAAAAAGAKAGSQASSAAGARGGAAAGAKAGAAAVARGGTVAALKGIRKAAAASKPISPSTAAPNQQAPQRRPTGEQQQPKQQRQQQQQQTPAPPGAHATAPRGGGRQAPAAAQQPARQQQKQQQVEKQRPPGQQQGDAPGCLPGAAARPSEEELRARLLARLQQQKQQQPQQQYKRGR